MQRRRFLHAVAAGGALALAGCSQDESNPFTEDTGTTAGDGGDGDDGSVLGGDGSDGDGSGGDGGGATATTAGGGTAADGGGDGGTGGTETASEGTATATEATGDGTATATDTGGDGTATATETGPDGTQTTVSTLEHPTIGKLDPTFEPSFRFTADFSGLPDSPDDASMDGAWHRGDFKGEWTAQGRTVQFYSVSDQTYIVADGTCTQLDSYPTQGVDTEEWVDTQDTEQRFQDLFDREAEGQTTIDGESMYVFELTATEAGTEYDVTYYLSADTGYLRRVETNDVVLEYYDWGNVGPIQAPC